MMEKGELEAISHDEADDEDADEAEKDKKMKTETR